MNSEQIKKNHSYLFVIKELKIGNEYSKAFLKQINDLFHIDNIFFHS